MGRHQLSFNTATLLTSFIYIYTQILSIDAASLDVARDTGKPSDSRNTLASSRQIDELDSDDIDVDGPYGYIPRVVNGVNKIVKGLLNGNMNQFFHGAFGIAPSDVSEDLIETYNRIVGLPDPDEYPELYTTRKPQTTTPKPTPVPEVVVAAVTARANSTVPAAAVATPLGQTVAAKPAGGKGSKGGKRKKQPQNDEDQDDRGEDEDDEDDEDDD